MTDLPAKKERAKQIRGPLERAIRLHIEGGKTLDEAAEMAEMQAESLRKALAKPHVKAFCTAVAHAWLAGRVAPAWHKVDRLIHESESGKVSLDAAKTLLGAAGQLQPDHQHAPSAGVAIQFVVHNTLPEMSQARPGVVELPPFNPATFRPREIAAADPAYVAAEG